MNNIHQFKIPTHRSEPKTAKIKETKDFNKSEAELVDVMHTFQHVISIIDKEKVKYLTFLQKGIDTRSTTSRKRSSQMKTSMSIAFSKYNDDETYHRRFTRKHSRPRCDRTVLLKFGTLTTLENAHNTADMKYSVYPVVKIAARSKDGKRFSEVINLQRKKQIFLDVNKTDCDCRQQAGKSR